MSTNKGLKEDKFMNEEDRHREHMNQMNKIKNFVERSPNQDYNKNRSPRSIEHDEKGDPYYRSYDHSLEDDIEQWESKPRTLKAKKQKGFEKGKPEGPLIPKNTKVFGLIDSTEKEKIKFLQKKKQVQNINKLSVILLNKEKQGQNLPTDPDNVGKSGPNSKLDYSPNSKKKFSRLAIAMIASRGPNCEDRVITKVMRDESGGVVDLGTIENKSKKYVVKQFGRKKKEDKSKAVKTNFNPKHRSKAAKIIQKWWRDILSNFQGLEGKLQKIQSVWRGYWYRKYLYDIIYYTYMTKVFVEKVNVPLRDKTRNLVFYFLQQQFAHKYWVKQNLFRIIKIQRKTQEFLKFIRDKKRRCVYLLDKIHHKKLFHGFNKIAKYAEKHENKEKKKSRLLDIFLANVKKHCRVKIFHELLWRIYFVPINEMKNLIFNKTLRFSFIQKHKTNVRSYLIKWYKNSKTFSNAYKPLAAMAIRKNIVKPLFDNLIGRMRRRHPKGLREKLLRRLIKDADKYSETVLKYFLNKWKQINQRLSVKEFKDNIGQKFLFRTSKRREFLTKSHYFRKWRSNVFAIGDIKPFIEGFPLLKQHILHKIFYKCMPKINNSMQGIKGRAVKNMFFSMPKFKKNVVRKYISKWKKIKAHLAILEASCLFLKSFKRGHNSKIITKLLTGRFNDWRRKAALLKFFSMRDWEDNLSSKNRGALYLGRHLKSYLQHKAFPLIYPAVKKHLLNIIKSKAVKEMFKKFKFLSKISLRKYFMKYKKIKEKMEKRELTVKMVSSFMKNFTSALRIKTLFMFFNRWHMNIPKHAAFDIQKGTGILSERLRKDNIKHLIKAFHQVVDRENCKEAMKKSLDFSKKFFKKKWNEYFYIWKKNADYLKHRAADGRMGAKFMSKFSTGLANRLLNAKFIQWKTNKPKMMTLHQIYLRNRDMSDAVVKYVNDNILNFKRSYWRRLKKSLGKMILLKAYRTLLEFAINGKKGKMNSFFCRWKDKCKDIELKNLRHQLMRSAVNQKIFRLKSKKLSSNLHRWRNQIAFLKADDHIKTHIHYFDGVKKLQKQIVKRAINFFFTKCKKLMTLDTRGKIIHMIHKRVNKPRYGLSHALERWRRRAGELKREAEVTILQRKICVAYTAKFAKRMERYNMLKRFHNWRYQEFYAIHVLPDIAKGFPLFKNSLRKKFLGLPFTHIMRSKNYRRFFEKIMPVGSKLQKRWAKNALTRFFKLWVVQKDRAKTYDLKIRIFEKTNGKYTKKLQMQTLLRKFRKWKQNAYKRPLYLQEAEAGLKNLEKSLRRLFVDPFIQNCKVKAMLNDKIKGLNVFLKSNKCFMKIALRLGFNRWWKKMLLFDDFSRPKVMRNIRRIFVENYILGPLEKFFRRWYKILYIKPLDGKTIKYAFKHIMLFCLKKSLKPLKFFTNLAQKRSPYYLEKQLVRKLLPNCKNLMKICLKFNLQKWKRKAEAMAVFAVKAKMMNNLYGKTQKTLLIRFIQKFFRRWAERDEVKKEIDFRHVIKYNNLIFGMMVRKYLVGFLPEMKEYSTKRFLRNCLLKQTKFHRKACEPFFKRWRGIYEFLKAKEMKGSFSGKLLQKTTKMLLYKKIRDIVRKRLKLWNANARALKEKDKDFIPEIAKYIRTRNLKKNLPVLLKKLYQNSIEVLKKRFTMGLVKKNGMCTKRCLRMYLIKWTKKVAQLQVKDVKLHIFKNHLKLSESKRKKMSLQRAFEKFKKREIEVTIQNSTAIHVAKQTLKRLFTRRPWAGFKKEVRMLNLKVAAGCTMGYALLHYNPHVCKSMALRNFIQRRYFKRWINEIRYLKTKELETQMFKKLFIPNARNTGRIALRRIFRIWEDKTKKIVTLQTKKTLKLRILKNIYAKNTRMCLKKFIRKWDNHLEKYYTILNRITLGVEKLRKVKRNPWRKLYNTVMFKGVFDKTPLAKKILTQWMRRNAKGALFWAFNTWIQKIADIRALMLNHKIAKNIFQKLNAGQTMKDKLVLVEKFTFWKILCSRKKFDFLSLVRMGHEKCGIGMRKQFNREVFKKIHTLYKKRKFVVDPQRLKQFNREVFKKIHTLYEKRKFVVDLQILVNKYDDEKKKEGLEMKFPQWREQVRLINEDLDKRFREMLKAHVKGPLRNRRITVPIRNLLDFAERSYTQKNKAANTISNFLRDGLKSTFKKLSLARFKKLSYIMQTIAAKENGQLGLTFVKWNYQANMLELDANIRTIQSYVRSKVVLVRGKRRVMNKAYEKTKNFINRRVFANIKDFARKKRIMQLLLRNIRDIPEELKHKFLRKYLKVWYADLIGAQNKTAADLINNMCRRYFAVKLKKKLKAKKFKMNRIVLKLLGKLMDKQKIYLFLWRLNSRLMATKGAANKILGFLGKKLNALLYQRAINSLRHKFKLFGWKHVKDVLRMCCSINKEKGQIFYENLKNIYYRKPFESIKNSSKWKSRIRKLGDILPRIMKSMKLFYIPYNLKKWQNQAEAIYLKNLIKIQNMVKGKLILLRKRAEVRRNFLVAKIISKLCNDDQIKMKIFLNFWKSKAAQISLQKATNLIGLIWKGNTSRKNIERQRKGINLKKVFRRCFIKMINRDMIRAFDNQETLRNKLSRMSGKFEKRYSTNNILDYANNEIRNMLLFKLTNNNNFKNTLSTLQRFLFRWKKASTKMNTSALKIQRNWYINQAKKRLALKRRFKELLLKKFKKYAISDEAKKNTYFRRWNTIHKMWDIIEAINKIQDFLRRRVQNVHTQKDKEFFIRVGKVKANKILLKAAKVSMLKKKLLRNPFEHFKKAIKYHLLLKRLLEILVKRFANIDSQLRYLYNKKYLLEWRKQMLRIRNKRMAAQLLIAKNMRRFLARISTGPLLRKKKLMTRIRDRFNNNMGIKFQGALWKWMGLAKIMNTFDAARVLQAYVRKIKQKCLEIKAGEKKDNVTRGKEKIEKVLNRRDLQKGLENIKDRAFNNYYRSLSRKIIAKTQSVRRDVVQRLKDWIKYKLDRIIFIQKEVKNFLFGRKIGRVLYNIKRLRFILKLMSDRDFRFKHKAMIQWNKIAYQIRLVSASENLQLFCKQKLLAYIKNQRVLILAQFRKFTNNLYIKGNLIPYARHYKNDKRFSKAVPKINRYIFKKFVQRCGRYDKLKCCSVIYNIRSKIIKRFLKKRFSLWHSKAILFSLIHSAIAIQKGYKKFIKRLRMQRLRKNLDNRLKALALKHSNKKRYYFLTWYTYVKRLMVQEAYDKMARFTKKHLIRARAMKRWKAWSIKLCKYENKFDIQDIVKQATRLRLFRKVVKTVNLHIYTKHFDNFLKKLKLIRVTKLLKLIFRNFEKRKEILMKYVMLKRWVKQERKLVHNDELVNSLVNIIDKRRKIMSFRVFDSFFKYKKLLRTIFLVKKKLYFHNLKEHRNHQLRMTKLFTLLQKCDDQLLSINRKHYKKTLYTGYTYRILTNFIARIHRIDKKYYIPLYEKTFFKNLANMYFSQSLFKYNQPMRERIERKEPIKLHYLSFSYSLDDTPKEKAREIEGSFLAAFCLNKILSIFLRRRKGWGFYHLKQKWVVIAFSKKVQLFCRKLLPSGFFLKQFEKKFNHMKIKPVMKQRLKRLFRLHLLRNFLKDKKDVYKKLRFVYFVNLVLMAKKTAALRQQKRSFRKWHYIITLKRLAKEKMLKLYQNMHLQFLNMANDMFGDEESAIFKEINKLSEKFEVFSAGHASVGAGTDHFKKQSCDFRKKYVFGDRTQSPTNKQEPKEEAEAEKPQIKENLNTVKSAKVSQKKVDDKSPSTEKQDEKPKEQEINVNTKYTKTKKR